MNFHHFFSYSKVPFDFRPRIPCLIVGSRGKSSSGKGRTMNISIKNWHTGATIYEGNHETLIAALEYCAKEGVSLDGANLDRANLVGANLDGANLVGANVVSLGYDSRGYHFLLLLQADGPRITAGCRSFSMVEAWKHWEDRHADQPLLRAGIHARLRMAEALIEVYQTDKAQNPLAPES